MKILNCKSKLLIWPLFYRFIIFIPKALINLHILLEYQMTMTDLIFVRKLIKRFRENKDFYLICSNNLWTSGHCI